MFYLGNAGSMDTPEGLGQLAEQARTFATRLIRIDPRELRLLDLNARYMTHEQYHRLVENIRNDGVLTSVPFACKDESGSWIVLSGNHRVRAAIDAGLDQIDVMVTDEVLPEAKRIALQLAHNAIAGQDDPVVLAQLWDRIDSVDLRAYTSLDDAALALMENVQVASISELGIEHRTVVMLFLPHEVDDVKRVFDNAMDMIRADEVWLADRREFNRLLDALGMVEKVADVHNRAATLRVMLDVFEQYAQNWAVKNTAQKAPA